MESIKEEDERRERADMAVSSSEGINLIDLTMDSDDAADTDYEDGLDEEALHAKEMVAACHNSLLSYYQEEHARRIEEWFVKVESLENWREAAVEQQDAADVAMDLCGDEEEVEEEAVNEVDEPAEREEDEMVGGGDREGEKMNGGSEPEGEKHGELECNKTVSDDCECEDEEKGCELEDEMKVSDGETEKKDGGNERLDTADVEMDHSDEEGKAPTMTSHGVTEDAGEKSDTEDEELALLEMHCCCCCRLAVAESALPCGHLMCRYCIGIQASVLGRPRCCDVDVPIQVVQEALSAGDFATYCESASTERESNV